MEILAEFGRPLQAEALAQKSGGKLGPKAFLIGVSGLLFFFIVRSLRTVFLKYLLKQGPQSALAKPLNSRPCKTLEFEFERVFLVWLNSQGFN